MIDNKKYNIYLEVKHELLLEDAKNFIKDYLAETHCCNSWDIDDDEIEKYDIEYLVQQFEEKEEYSSPFSELWENLVSDYMEDFEDEE